MVFGTEPQRLVAQKYVPPAPPKYDSLPVDKMLIDAINAKLAILTEI